MSFSYSNPCDVPATLDFSDTSVAGPPPNTWLQMRFTDSNGFTIIKPMTIPPGVSGTLTGVTAAHSGQLTVANTTTIGPVAATIDRSDGTQPPMRVLGPTITVTPNIPTITLTVNPDSLTAKTNQTVNWQISDNSWPYQRTAFHFNPNGYLLLTGVQQFGVDFFAPAVTAPVPISVTVTPSFWALDLGRFVDGPPTNPVTVTVNPQAGATPNRLQLEAISVVPGNDDEFISTTDPNAREAHFPLGSTFQIKLWKLQPDGSRAAVPASFTLDSSPSFTNNLGPDPMFPNDVVFPFLPQTGTSGMTFQATHLGSQNLIIAPTDATLSAVTVKLVVGAPKSLGSTHNDLDARIIPLADSTGVPPQMIKGQVAAEGRFSPITFRYEPLNNDVGDLAISRGNDLRSRAPYSNFRLPTVGDSFDPGGCRPFPDVNLGIPDPRCPGLAIGGNFSQHEMDVITGANQEFRLRTWQRDAQTGQLVLNQGQRVSRRLTAADLYVSARDVLEASDGIFHFRQQIRDPIVRNQREARLTFTGEFPLAGSYGFLQVMYVTAVGQLRWQGVNPPCDGATSALDPSGLYDTPCNLRNGGGSLGLGTRKVKNDFIGSNGATPTIATPVILNDRLADAYQLYNSGKTGYGQDVVSRAPNFPPNGSRKIF